MGKKGLAVLKGLVQCQASVSTVVVGRDRNVQNDYAVEIDSLAKANGIASVGRSEFQPEENVTYFVAGWRWMIRGIDQENLIVFHDSLLPRYRGFAPLVNALINGEERIGVTALQASEQYDEGPILTQRSIEIGYPLKIARAIDRVSELYTDIATDLARSLTAGDTLTSVVQDHQSATYSLWRSEEDYAIDWRLHCGQIERFVDAVGYPYKGAIAATSDSRFIIDDVEALEGYRFESYQPGKVFRLEDGQPIVVAGESAVKIVSMRDATDGASVLPWSKIRTRFI